MSFLTLTVFYVLLITGNLLCYFNSHTVFNLLSASFIFGMWVAIAIDKFGV